MPFSFLHSCCSLHK